MAVSKGAKGQTLTGGQQQHMLLVDTANCQDGMLTRRQQMQHPEAVVPLTPPRSHAAQAVGSAHHMRWLRTISPAQRPVDSKNTPKALQQHCKRLPILGPFQDDVVLVTVPAAAKVSL